MDKYRYIYIYIYITYPSVCTSIYKNTNMQMYNIEIPGCSFNNNFFFLLKSIGCETKHLLFVRVALWRLKPISNDRFRCVDMAIWRNFTVSVWKGGFKVETVWHYNFGFNTVLSRAGIGRRDAKVLLPPMHKKKKFVHPVLKRVWF